MAVLAGDEYTGSIFLQVGSWKIEVSAAASCSKAHFRNQGLSSDLPICSSWSYSRVLTAAFTFCLWGMDREFKFYKQNRLTSLLTHYFIHISDLKKKWKYWKIRVSRLGENIVLFITIYSYIYKILSCCGFRKKLSTQILKWKSELHPQDSHWTASLLTEEVELPSPSRALQATPLLHTPPVIQRITTLLSISIHLSYLNMERLPTHK